MTSTRTLVPAAIVIALAACASGSTDKATGPSQLLNVTLQPVRVSPNPEGAMLLSEVTGCLVQYVGKGPSEPVFQFTVAPTARVPSMDQCLASLRSQPGVTGVQVVK